MARKSSGTRSGAGLSLRTRKAIDTLPSRAQHIYRKAHKNALEQYASPSRGAEAGARAGSRLRTKSRGLL